jgi:hypothetical protein
MLHAVNFISAHDIEKPFTLGPTDIFDITINGHIGSFHNDGTVREIAETRFFSGRMGDDLVFGYLFRAEPSIEQITRTSRVLHALRELKDAIFCRDLSREGR